jgi:hypothetical protein
MINAFRMASTRPDIEMVGEIAVFGEAQVGKTCFIDMVGHYISRCSAS